MYNTYWRQQWLRERNTVLRYTCSVYSVQSYVPLLCTSTVFSVYRAPSVIMCSSALILPSFGVSAVRFVMRYHFSTRALTALCQSHASAGTAHTCAWERILWKCYNLLQQKGGKMSGLKLWKEKITGRKKDKYQATEWIGDLVWRVLDWGLEMAGIKGLHQGECVHMGGCGGGDKMWKVVCMCVCVWCVCFVDRQRLYLAL